MPSPKAENEKIESAVDNTNARNMVAFIIVTVSNIKKMTF
ncbi:hypothetical protein VCRA2123O159_160091 [Vibrio crassostreae]|nr:hypothetical protein VCRA2119O149_1040016 [Vibrio crassostreae]CAK2593773.1 hypothetical protein VCRA2121O154_110121 [Vibrio crassostreae]CAK2656657.1 hypothetical protein VCRA2127O160_110016 [Vibrio crassostreae]CAK2660846.1 hypothetical protein VCRA2119O148_160091 [Vibrio crassostreae]CAK3158718.1 hypothetical protein VCRA2121O152_110015 [Vibrio crassostreae]